MNAVRVERTAHPVPPGHVSARQRRFEPVSGFEPLTVRLQGGCSAKLSYTGRLASVLRSSEALPAYRFGAALSNRSRPP